MVVFVLDRIKLQMHYIAEMIQYKKCNLIEFLQITPILLEFEFSKENNLSRFRFKYSHLLFNNSFDEFNTESPLFYEESDNSGRINFLSPVWLFDYTTKIPSSGVSFIFLLSRIPKSPRPATLMYYENLNFLETRELFHNNLFVDQNIRV